MGFKLKNVFANPLKTITDVGTFGFNAVAREVFKEKKITENVTRVYGGTVVGGATGFVGGGLPGLYVGAAAGFGRGVAAAAHGEDTSGTKLIGQYAITGGIAGGVTGAITGQGLAGFVRQQIVKGATAVKGALPSAKGFTNLLGGLAVAKSLLPNNLGLPSPSGQAADVDLSRFGSSPEVGGPANSPLQYVPAPTTGLTSVGTGGLTVPGPVVIDTTAEPSDNTNWLVWILVALVIGYVLVKKKVFR